MPNRILCARVRLISMTAALGIEAVLHTGSSVANDSPAGLQDARLAEITVTAQKRDENLQDVPIAVQVISGVSLSEQNYNSLGALSQTVPGLFVTPTGGDGEYTNSLYIRGVGSGSNPAFEQSVATFIDDIYHGRSRQTDATFLDLDRIEVLKGPQSTFFGNNAIAGALNITTRRPGDAVDAFARALYGMHGQYAGEGGIGGPIGDTFGARLAVMRSGESGWIENVNTGRKAPHENNRAARLSLVFKPGEHLDAILKIESNQSNVSGITSQFINCPLPAPFTNQFSGTCANALSLNSPIGLNNNRNAALPGQGTSLSSFEDVLTINYRQWGHTFTSVTGHYNYSFDLRGAAINGPGPDNYNSNVFGEHYHQFSQELRVASPTGGPVEYLLGAYFQTDHLNWPGEDNAPFINGLPAALGPPYTQLIPYLPLAFTGEFTQSERDYSAFGSLSWNVTDRLKLNAGLRASEVKKEFTGSTRVGTTRQVYDGIIPVPPDIVALWHSLLGFLNNASNPLPSLTERALMPSAGVQFKIDPQSMVYFSYSRGFKAGGYDGLNALFPPQESQYGPEHVNAYELGLKSTWLDDRLVMNVDVFRSDYRGLQVEAIVPVELAGQVVTQNLVRNAASSRSEGVEFETQWAVSSNFRLSGNVTYLHSYYVSYPNAARSQLQAFCAESYVLPYCSIYPNPVPAFRDVSGQLTPFAPRWSGSVIASYTATLPGEYRFTAEVSPYFSSKYNQLDPNLIGTSGYVRLDGRLTLATPDSHWAVDIIGKNLTDRVIVESQPGVVSFTTASKEEPRNVAIQLRYKW